MDAVWVSLAVTAGLIAVAGVPLRCWQLYSGRLRARVPRHLLAQATFALFAVAILVPNVAGWFYLLFVAWRDFGCAACEQRGMASAGAAGMLGCAYALLEGFLLVAQRRGTAAAGEPRSLARGRETPR
jgi:hypothetical protein